MLDASDFAVRMVLNHGWSVAHEIALAEAELDRRPTGNLDRFWTRVLEAIERGATQVDWPR